MTSERVDSLMIHESVDIHDCLETRDFLKNLDSPMIDETLKFMIRYVKIKTYIFHILVKSSNCAWKP